MYIFVVYEVFVKYEIFHTPIFHKNRNPPKVVKVRYVERIDQYLFVCVLSVLKSLEYLMF